MWVSWIHDLLREVNSMKKTMIGALLCACLSLTALFGGVNANTMQGRSAAGPQCDLPPAFVEQ